MVNSRVDKIRSMANVPLDLQGQKEATAVAKRMYERKGVAGVSASTRTRAIQTATEILKYNPQAQMIDITSALEPWHMGEFEGEPSSTVHENLESYVNDPSMKVPGVGAGSKVPGESLDSFLKRFLPYLKKQTLINPKGYGLVLCCHYRNIKAAQAWAANGGKDDYSIDPETFMDYTTDETPASLWCVEYENGKWVVEPEELFTEEDPLDDVYLLRHGKTSMNGSASSGPISS